MISEQSSQPSQQPKVSISYNPTSNEFTVKVINTTAVSYTLEYDWENIGDDEEAYGGTDALINTADADLQNVFQDTQLAGTESSGDKFIQNPVKGVLTLSADTTNGKVFTYQAGFKMTEEKSVKIISEKITSKEKSGLNVLGESTTSAEPVTATFSQPVIEKRTNAVQPTANAGSVSDETFPIIPVVIGVGIVILLVGVVGMWFYKKRVTSFPKI